MKKLFVSTSIALLIVIAASSIGLAAISDREAGGSFISTSTTIHNAMDDKFNEIFVLSSTITYSGALEGTSTLQGMLTVRRDGSANFQGMETFTGLANRAIASKFLLPRL